MATVIQDRNKIGKEQLLLGNKTITRKDCKGTDMIFTGLISNDLVIKNGKIFENLKVYIDRVAGGSNMDIASGLVTMKDGTKSTLQKVIDGLEDVKFEITDLQAKYNTLKG